MNLSRSNLSPKPARACVRLLAAALCTAALAQPAPQQDQPLPTTPATPPGTTGVWSSFPRPDSSLPYLDLKDAWPDRITPPGTPPGTKGIIQPADSAVELTTMLAPDKKTDAEALGLDIESNTVLFEGPGSFCLGFSRTRRRGDVPDSTFRFVSGTRVPGANPESPDRTAVTRTWFDLYLPAATAEKPRGVVLLMPGMFGTPEGVLGGLANRLRADGWYILRMVAQPSRFTERVEFVVSPDENLAPQAAQIATLFRERTAECAYAAAAAGEHIRKTYPDTQTLPWVTIGFSAGAMTLPTVAAYEPDRYAASIIVGGGCHFWLMNERSNYKDWIDAVRVRWTTPPEGQDRRQLNDAYLSQNPLDSFHTASVLRGRPTLFILGTTDFAVPTPLGHSLWERCDKPERWDIRGGHEVLFMQLHKNFDRMVDWLKVHTSKPDSPTPPK